VYSKFYMVSHVTRAIFPFCLCNVKLTSKQSCLNEFFYLMYFRLLNTCQVLMFCITEYETIPQIRILIIILTFVQTNTAIYQDVFSCVPNDLIHTRYVGVIVVHFLSLGLSLPLYCPNIHHKPFVSADLLSDKTWLYGKKKLDTLPLI
jgi:hypothetical protein